MIRLSVVDRFGDEQTSIMLDGDGEVDICNVLVSRLQAVDYAIEIEDHDGYLIPFEDYDHE